MKKTVKCGTPYCNTIITPKIYPPKEMLFCDQCKRDHSMCVLKIQAELEKPIKEIIIDASLFKTANGMSDYAGVSFVTMYNWIDKYFKLSFQEFKRLYICRSTKCYMLNIKRSTYSRNDYILKKIKSRSNYCACVNALEPNHIMTNCPPKEISRILRGCPKINKISDNLFSLVPKFLHIFPWKPIILDPSVFLTIPKEVELQ